MSSINTVNAGTISSTELTERSETTGKKSGIDFTSILADALKDQAVQMSISAASGTKGATGSSGASGMSGASGLTGGYMQPQSQGIEQMILAAASSGEVSDAQTALFMLCMMMQTNQDGEFSMLMQMMVSMVTQMQSEAANLRNTVMDSGYDPYVLDAIDEGVFGNRISSTSTTGEPVLPVEFWRPASPVVTSDEENRSVERYRAVLDQFSVETAERYRPGRDDYTYCNIFVWDVTSAMGAEIPHYTDPETGEPRYYPDTKGAKAMGAIAIDNWLEEYGWQYGWTETDAVTAQQYANSGRPAVTSAGSLGHVQMVCPSEDGGYDAIRGVTVAQAGRIVTNYAYLSGTYSTTGQQSVRYWVHN